MVEQQGRFDRELNSRCIRLFDPQSRSSCSRWLVSEHWLLPCLFRSTELTLQPESEAWMATYPLQIQCPVCDLVSHFAKPGFRPRPMQGYYRRRYFDHLQQHPPKVFVDPGPQQFKYQYSDAYDFESFPELRKYLNADLGPSSAPGAAGGARVFASPAAVCARFTNSTVKSPLPRTAGGTFMRSAPCGEEDACAVIRSQCRLPHSWYGRVPRNGYP